MVFFASVSYEQLLYVIPAVSRSSCWAMAGTPLESTDRCAALIVCFYPWSMDGRG